MALQDLIKAKDDEYRRQRKLQLEREIQDLTKKYNASFQDYSDMKGWFLLSSFLTIAVLLIGIVALKYVLDTSDSQALFPIKTSDTFNEGVRFFFSACIIFLCILFSVLAFSYYRYMSKSSEASKDTLAQINEIQKGIDAL